jgi:uncharacterized membrane protein YfhO
VRTAGASGNYTTSGLNRVRIDLTDSPSGLLLVLDPYGPGWVARMDGKMTEIFRVDYLFRAVAVPPGTPRVEMVDRPTSVHIGVAIGSVSAVVIVIAISSPFITRARQRRRSARVQRPAFHQQYLKFA